MTRGARRSDVARATRWLLLAAALGLAGGGCRDGGASPSGSVDAGPVPLPAEADGVTGAQVAETAETAAPTNRRPPETEARGAEDADDGGGDADSFAGLGDVGTCEQRQYREHRCGDDRSLALCRSR